MLLLSNVHLLGLLLACSIHVYFLLSIKQQKKAGVILHILLGAVILFPAACFITPPYNGTSNMSFLLHAKPAANLFTPVQLPLRAFIPIPAWWQYHFWNTQFLLTGQENFKALKYVNPLISIKLIILLLLLLRKNKKAMLLFATNVLLTCIVSAFVFPLTSERYVGFIFTGFIAAYWLYCNEAPVSKTQTRFVALLLFAQLVAGVFAVTECLRFHFSNLYRVNELLRKVPANQRVVGDYWALNAMAAYTNKPVYCIDMQKSMQFILWQEDMAYMVQKKFRYTEGTAFLFKQEKIKSIYIISTAPPVQIAEADANFFKVYKVRLVDKTNGAVEKGSDLYLYEVGGW
jgi:hypothetical protein